MPLPRHSCPIPKACPCSQASVTSSISCHLRLARAVIGRLTSSTAGPGGLLDLLFKDADTQALALALALVCRMEVCLGESAMVSVRLGLCEGP